MGPHHRGPVHLHKRSTIFGKPRLMCLNDGEVLIKKMRGHHHPHGRHEIHHGFGKHGHHHHHGHNFMRMFCQELTNKDVRRCNGEECHANHGPGGHHGPGHHGSGHHGPGIHGKRNRGHGCHGFSLGDSPNCGSKCHPPGHQGPDNKDSSDHELEHQGTGQLHFKHQGKYGKDRLCNSGRQHTQHGHKHPMFSKFHHGRGNRQMKIFWIEEDDVNSAGPANENDQIEEESSATIHCKCRRIRIRSKCMKCGEKVKVDANSRDDVQNQDDEAANDIQEVILDEEPSVK